MAKVIKSPIRPAAAKPQQGSLKPASPPTAAQPVRKPIIDKEIVSAKQEARRILSEAEQTAQRTVEEAQAQAEELRQKGYEEGFEEGKAVYIQKIAGHLLELEKYKHAVEPEFIRLVRSCVEKIIGQELKINPEAIVGIVRNVLRDATQQQQIYVRVHPKDVEVLRKQKRRLLDVLASANAIEIREDESVAQGGCIVVTELGTIDASLERQLAAIEALLDDELKHGSPDPVGEGEEEESAEYEEEYEESYED